MPQTPIQIGEYSFTILLEPNEPDGYLVTCPALPGLVTEGDTLDEEARQEVPRPPLPSVNRARGRIGFDTMETVSHGTTNTTSSSPDSSRSQATRIFRAPERSAQAETRHQFFELRRKFQSQHRSSPNPQ